MLALELLLISNQTFPSVIDMSNISPMVEVGCSNYMNLSYLPI